jgi:stage II sporulation protein R
LYITRRAFLREKYGKDFYMKTVVFSFLTFALALFIAFALPTAGEEAVYENVLRLHVVAASDEAADQAAKIAVRDAVLGVTGEEMQRFSTLAEAKAWAEANEERMEAAANAALKEMGASYCARITFEKKYFDTRTYDGFTLPAGEYASVTVTLGEGRGQNFWCMLYPSLCTVGAVGDKVDEKEAAEDPRTLLFTDSNYALRFKSLEFLTALLGQG